MFQWLLLKENALSAAENTVWKESALRIILVSGLLLEFGIGLLSAIDAVKVGAYYIVVIVTGFFLALSLAVFASVRRPVIGSAMLIATIYAAAFCIVYFINDAEIAKLGIMFVYTAPLIARIFFGSRLALVLMAVNVFPFMLLLRNEPLPSYPGLVTPLANAHAYIQALLFLFFNICVPLGVFRLLHALDAAIRRHRTASSELESSHAQYQEIFENAGGAILLCDAQARILKANSLADAIIGRQDRKSASLFALLAHKCKDREEKTADILALKPGQEFETRDGRLISIETISPTSENHYIVLLRDISQMRRIQEALTRSKERESFLSSHDQLTHLPNRDLMLQQLGTALSTMPPRRQLALIIIRLDSIKYVNDAHGNAAGDDLIVAFADVLRRLLPDASLCGRLRSVVFGFTIESTHGRRDAIPQIEHIRRSLPEELVINGERQPVQISMAVAFSRPGETSGDELLQRGKLALDTARRSGGQNVAVFDDEAAAQIRRRLNIEQAILMALRENELRLVYQPKVTRDGEIVGLEALIRWRSPTLGDVSPAEFIPVAESSGAIHFITAFVVDSVCTYIRQTLDAGDRCLPIAINLSAIDIVRADLLDLVNASCLKHRVSSDYLEFEITETGLVGNENLAISHLEALNAKGYGITIDDFGTGYSSLQKLSRFPTKSIKIDQSFVAQIGISEKSELIIRAVVSLAKILSCTTVAEGVETLVQEKFLKAIGCQFFQGFYYYPPMEFQQVNQLLKGR
ncbi:diguanylate cyclase (GGDEF) domain-containing protein [Herbaspirillum sp. CF444]|uniref:putative bifunctional diguanylate cyclase/phosphodiesterase n=1 Tax=Herbaspirillum sp. CF444 TaxID=1144319 RepID=UPI00027278DF|nr:bifunctional diguanylate cyclase/phosphodiesterase [Herbaspirillum sp. CF444]EJL92297.1 diguanylate cyclase (GGDEF) domain-containing protein [Herbaspirillum sp. CF444]